MSESSPLDVLASNKIINFDPEAFVKGTTPRYVGDPDGETYLPFEQPLMATPTCIPPIGTPLSGQPEHDEFSGSGHHEKKHNWRKILTAVLAAGLLVLGGIKLKSAFGKLAEKLKLKKANAAPKQGFLANIKTKVTGWFNKVKSAITGKPVPVQQAPQTATTATNTAANTGKTATKKVPKWLKIAGGSFAGLLGLYALFKMFAGRHPQQSVMVVPTQTMALANESEAAQQQALAQAQQGALSAVPVQQETLSAVPDQQATLAAVPAQEQPQMQPQAVMQPQPQQQPPSQPQPQQIQIQPQMQVMPQQA